MTSCSESMDASQNRALEILSWVAARKIPPGPSIQLRLPDRLARESVDGHVHVAPLPDGRLCILLKKQIGYKDNFEALLLCSDPLREEEFIEDSAHSRTYVSLDSAGIFEELPVRRRVDNRTTEVYFDLN